MRYDGTPNVKQRVPAKLPVATVSILLVTGILTGLQFAFPQILPALMRSPAAVSKHEWWRFVTPLFVHADGWKQIAFVLPAVLVVGTLAERIHGSRQVLLLYFVSGFAGEIVGLAWKPYGAGASVAGAGLLGALAVWMLARNKTPQAVFGIDRNLRRGRSPDRDEGHPWSPHIRGRRPRSRNAKASAVV